MNRLLARWLPPFPDPAVEREWRAYREDQARGPARLGMLVFGALIMLAGLGDEWQGYEGWQTVLLVRLALWGPVMFLAAGLVSLPRFRGRVLDVTFGVALLLTASLIGLMLLVLPRSAAIDYPMYWTVLLLLVHVVAPLGFVRACLVGALVVAGFFATMLRYDAEPAHFAAHTVFLLFAWILLIAASGLLESRARATFLAERQLLARTRELDQLTRLQTAVLDTLSEGVCGLDALGVVTFANPAAAFLLGRPATAVVGARFHDTFHDAEPAGAGACPLCASTAPVQDVPARLRLPDGGTRWVECASRPDEGGNHPGVRVLSFRDVSRRRELEAQVRHSQKMEAIGLFVGGVAHEFNNLLTPILAGVELAGTALGPEHPAHAPLTRVGRAGSRAAELVRQLLTLGSRVDAAPQAVDLSANVTQALAFIEPTLDRRIQITFEPPPAAWALADPGQVDQVLLNLCLNARDALLPDVEAGRPARITLSVRTVLRDAPTAAEPGARAGRWIELAVADTGPGIPPDVLPRMFDPFFTTKPRGETSGLGLAVLHGIVQAHGGWVTVDTAPGAGTRIACFFPATAPPPEPVRVVPPASPGAEPQRILLVDDEQMVRDAARRCLEHVGFTVEEAPGGVAALSLLQAGSRPDLVLLDIQMPELDGWRTLAGIRALDATLPVVMMTGYDARAAEPRPHAPDGMLRKPFRIEQLARTCREAIARGAGRQPE